MDSSIEFSPRHSTGWTGETPMSFDQYFSRLPTEIRLIIWRKNFSQPRVINLIPNTNYTQIVSRSQTPSFLHACLESRMEGLKFYETLGVPTYNLSLGDGWTLCPYEEQPMARVLINFETDTIFFGREMFANVSAIELAVRGMHIQHQKIRKMGIHYSGCQTCNTFNDEILQCHALEKLYMIFDDRPPSGRQSIIPGGDHLREVEVGGKYCTEHNIIDWPPDKEEKLKKTFTFVRKSENWGNYVDERENSILGLLGLINHNDLGVADDRDLREKDGVQIAKNVYQLTHEEVNEFIEYCRSTIREIPTKIKSAVEARYRAHPSAHGEPNEDWDWVFEKMLRLPDLMNLLSWQPAHTARILEAWFYNTNPCLPSQHGKVLALLDAASLVMSDMSESISQLRVAREGITIGKSARRRMLYDTFLDVLSTSEREEVTREVRRAHGRKDFVNRYIHCRLQYRRLGGIIQTKRNFRRHFYVLSFNHTIYGSVKAYRIATRGNANIQRHMERQSDLEMLTKKVETRYNARMMAYEADELPEEDVDALKERRKIDPDARAKLEIMSRKGPGRRFAFREDSDDSIHRYGHDSKTRSVHKLGTKKKSKLKGMISVRKARPALERDALRASKSHRAQRNEDSDGEDPLL